MGRPDASLEEIQQAAHMAHAHTFITRLPEGYNTQARGVREQGPSNRALPYNTPWITNILLTMPILHSGGRERDPTQWWSEAADRYRQGIVEES